METSAQKSQKTSSGLGKLYVYDRENGGKIGTSILHLVSRHLQGSDWGPAGLKKQG